MKHTPGIAIVTGASSGIGASFARRLAAAAGGLETYRHLPSFDELWLVARRGDRLAGLEAELTAKYRYLTVKTIVLDLVEDGAIDNLAALVKDSRRQLSILINNAGYGTYGPFAEVDLERQLGQIDLNCRSLTESCGRLGPYLCEGSLVINVASLAGFAPMGGFAVYAASKAYVLSFSVALGAEWARRGIRVSALCPGSVASEFALVASNGARREVRHGANADLTTKRALRDAARGRAVSLPLWKWKLRQRAAIVFGPVASAWFAWRFLRRPHKVD